MIQYFRGDFVWLSNFYPSYVEVGPITAHTIENAYQACKAKHTNDFTAIITAVAPGEAKRLGKQCAMVENWDRIKVIIMRDLLRQKFKRHSMLADMLVDTDPQELIEGNNWHDNFWGDCICNDCEDVFGRNMLGKLLMDIRRELL